MKLNKARLYSGWKSYCESSEMITTYLLFGIAICLALFEGSKNWFGLIGAGISIAILYQRFINYLTREK